MTATMETMVRAEIAKLEAALADLHRQRRECEEERTLFPGRDTQTLRENYYRSENQRSGLRGIDSAIEGIEQQLAFYRGQLA